MVEQKVVLESVKKMLDSGLDLDVIKSTLKDIGLSDSEADAIIAQASGKPIARAKPEVEEQSEGEEFFEEKISKDLENHKELHNLAQTTTHAALTEHAEKLENARGRVEELHEKFDSLSEKAVVPTAELIAELNSLKNKVNTFDQDLKEVKALCDALQSILKKILETDRQVLLELERKKK